MKSKLNITLRIIIICILFTISSMSFAYLLINKDTIQWYLLGLCISLIFISLIMAIIVIATILFID